MLRRKRGIRAYTNDVSRGGGYSALEANPGEQPTTAVLESSGRGRTLALDAVDSKVVEFVEKGPGFLTYSLA